MNPLEQYLKPPIKNVPGFSGEKIKKNNIEEKEYFLNQDNENIIEDNNQEEFNQNEELNESNNNQNNFQLDDKNDENVIKGINYIKENEIGQEPRKIGNNNGGKIEFNDKDILNENGNEINDVNEEINKEDDGNKDESLSDILNQVENFKKYRMRKNKNIIENEKNELNNMNEISQMINKRMEMIKDRRKIENNNKNDKIIQNNQKMKELSDLLKDYNNIDKNRKYKIQLNFVHNNQINIVNPEYIFADKDDNSNKILKKSVKNNHYISAIDGKAIINGQRLDLNNLFQFDMKKDGKKKSNKYFEESKLNILIIILKIKKKKVMIFILKIYAKELRIKIIVLKNFMMNNLIKCNKNYLTLII